MPIPDIRPVGTIWLISEDIPLVSMPGFPVLVVRCPGGGPPVLIPDDYDRGTPPSTVSLARWKKEAQEYVAMLSRPCIVGHGAEVDLFGRCE